MAQNHSLTAFAGFIRVAPRTVYYWLANIPEFRNAVEIARARRLGKIEDNLNDEKLTGPKAMVNWNLAKNVAPAEYRDKVEIESKGDSNTALFREMLDAFKRVSGGAGENLSIASEFNSSSIIDGEYEDITPHTDDNDPHTDIPHTEQIDPHTDESVKDDNHDRDTRHSIPAPINHPPTDIPHTDNPYTDDIVSTQTNRDNT